MELKKIEIGDIVKYRAPENLTVNPSGSAAAFQVAYADMDKNSYKRDVWLIENDTVRQLTATLSASIVLWLDDTHLRRRLTEQSFSVLISAAEKRFPI